VHLGVDLLGSLSQGGVTVVIFVEGVDSVGHRQAQRLHLHTKEHIKSGHKTGAFQFMKSLPSKCWQAVHLVTVEVKCSYAPVVLAAKNGFGLASTHSRSF